MVPVLTDEIHDLEKGQAFSIDRAYRRTVRSVEAQLWLTEEGSLEDLVLAPGDCYTIQTRGRVAIEPLDGKVRFAISPPVAGKTSLGEFWHGFWSRVWVKQRRFESQ